MKILAYLLTFALAGAVIMWCPTVTLTLPLGQGPESVGSDVTAPDFGSKEAARPVGLSQTPLLVITPAAKSVEGHQRPEPTSGGASEQGEHGLEPAGIAPPMLSRSGPTP